MDIKEKAKEYAKGKALEAMTAAIEQAYADGYNDGMQHRENLILESIVDGVEYVDLQLPSGKMWSSSYVKDKDQYSLLPYIETSKLNIPTKEDFDELCKYCAKDYYLTKDVKGIQFTGVNGNKIIIPYHKSEDKADEVFTEHFTFWIRDDDDSTLKSKAFNTSRKEGIVGYVNKTFMGYKLPIMLVKEGSKI